MPQQIKLKQQERKGLDEKNVPDTQKSMFENEAKQSSTGQDDNDKPKEKKRLWERFSLRKEDNKYSKSLDEINKKATQLIEADDNYVTNKKDALDKLIFTITQEDSDKLMNLCANYSLDKMTFDSPISKEIEMLLPQYRLLIREGEAQQIKVGFYIPHVSQGIIDSFKDQAMLSSTTIGSGSEKIIYYSLTEKGAKEVEKYVDHKTASTGKKISEWIQARAGIFTFFAMAQPWIMEGFKALKPYILKLFQ